MTRILLLNPNTSASVTERMMVVARKSATPGTEVIGHTVTRGVPYIATRAEAVIGGAVALEALAERAGEFDAAIIAAFGDPGLSGARELLDVPVIGLAEAGLLTACMLGHRFSVVSFSTALGPWYRECVTAHGLASRLASIRLLDGPFRSIAEVPEEKADLLVRLAQKAVEEDGADVIVLAGAPLAGLAGAVKHLVPVPVIECTAAAVRQAELLVGLDPAKARAGSFARPEPKTSIGLPPPLARLLATAGDDMSTVSN
ncbi:aspartate/glutamate racemase family protein [Martelella sp. HB161492]|uniref:aspartate/glutamate racemase family protein n=1 Tax=Martelella sp. HB161492 TaxID=2720726 RepID=UPI001590628C|nr:aspartate/glutamate racemase family protein [Martelella sp. HB161492]